MKVVILDGNSVMNRAFYGSRPLTTPDGTFTNAVLTFLNMMDKVRREESPDGLCVAFDLKGPTFRHLRYEGYKATRHPMPEELAMQMPLIREVLAAMNIPVYTAEGWEADDVLGTVGRICRESGNSCVIVTGDRDSLQLIDGSVSVRLTISKPGSNETTLYTERVFQDEYGFEPVKLIDLKALMGDSSDNIPGVSGVGKKTAADLLVKYGSLDGIYVHLDELRESLRKKLEADRGNAYLSYELAAIRTDAPVDFKPEECQIREPDRCRLLRIFEKLCFVRLIDQYRLREAEQESVKAQETSSLVELPEPEGTIALILGEKSMALANDDGAMEIGLDLGYLRKLALSATVICCDYKSLLRRFDVLGLPRPKGEDLSLMAYVINPSDTAYTLDKLVARYLTEGQADSLAGSASQLFRLFSVLEKRIREQGTDAVYREIDLPLCPVLADMENEGILVDKKQLKDFQKRLEERIDSLQREIILYAGEDFNINSTKALGEILFDKLQLPAGKKTKNGYSTNADVLEKIRLLHPIVDAVLEYRQLTKLRSTYAEGLIKVINPDGRIRTTFQNTVTATGRLSSTEPNLQNIPVRSDLGSEIRRMFISKPGFVLVDADYSQIELRVLADMAEDEAMRNAFLSGEDFHSVTASQVFNVPLDEVTPQMRRNAKAVNFGIVYGITKWSLSEDLHVSPYEAEEYINSYLDRFKGVRAYMQNVVREARESGYVTTRYGRRRPLPELKSSNFNLRSAAERMALNTPIQGTAADIIKIAMIRVSDVLKRECPEARLLLQVHDELIVECPEEQAETVMGILSREMTSAAQLSVPLVAEAAAGKNWMEAK